MVQWHHSTSQIKCAWWCWWKQIFSTARRVKEHHRQLELLPWGMADPYHLGLRECALPHSAKLPSITSLRLYLHCQVECGWIFFEKSVFLKIPQLQLLFYKADSGYHKLKDTWHFSVKLKTLFKKSVFPVHTDCLFCLLIWEPTFLVCSKDDLSLWVHQFRLRMDKQPS